MAYMARKFKTQWKNNSINEISIKSIDSKLLNEIKVRLGYTGIVRAKSSYM